MKTTASNRKLRQLLTGIKNRTLLPRPEFQRRLVWTNKHKVSFLETVLSGYPFPEIYIAAGEVDADTGEGTELLVDGQQRLTTLYEYFHAGQNLRLGKLVPSYSSLGKDDKLAFLEYDVVIRDLGKMSVTQIKEVFTRINSTNYALNAMEISNARFEGALKSFAESVSQLYFFEEHHTFSATEMRRMLDLRYCLTIIVTMMSAYFNRDDELEQFLTDYNDELDPESELRQRIEETLATVDSLALDNKSRAWKKSDLFTLIIEIDRILHQDKIDIDTEIAGANLAEFYRLVDDAVRLKKPDELLTQYYRASIQATNDRSSRTRRGEVIRLVLQQDEEIDWGENGNGLGSEKVEEMVSWFFEHYMDPAEGVPYDSAEGGYMYVNGGPYDPEEELEEEFPDVHETIRERAVARIVPSGWEWVKKDEY